jgi:hypothetical protein
MFQYHTNAANMHYHRLPHLYREHQIFYDISRYEEPQVLNPEVTTSNHESPYVWLTVLKSPSKRVLVFEVAGLQ